MPLYEYKCDACGRRFERIQRFSEPPPDSCTLCGGGPVHKLLSSPAIQFKGSGWYITDYARKQDQKGGAKTEGGGSAADGGGKEKPAKAKGDAADKTSAASEKSTSAGTEAKTESREKNRP
jgi:putative FmdB family regulatory protein